MKTLKEAKSEKFHKPIYYRYQCQHCGEELVMSSDELKHILFEPYEKEFEQYRIQYEETSDGKIGKKFKEVKEVVKRQVSSDSSKDVFKFTCCACGKENSVSTKDYWDHHCDEYGEDKITFTLSEKETKDAREFLKEQRNLRKGKKIDAMGMTATYTLTPGGLGTLITVKDNYTGNSKDVTDTSNW